jgi:RimJ/RimL family protein N-acetyltransferase
MYFGEKVKIRALEITDLPAIMKHWNNWENRRATDMVMPRSELSEQKWLEKVSTPNPWRDGYVFFAIEEKISSEYLGTTTLQQVNANYRSAEYGIMIHNPENFGKGYGTDTTRVMLWVAFHILGLNSVMLRAFDFNKSGIRAYEKAGFKHVGVLRKAAFVEGQFIDVVVMDILNEEFFENYPPGTYIVETSGDFSN